MSMHRGVTAVVMVLLLSGCMIGPDYSRPTVEAPAAWRITEQEAKDLADTAWWEQFQDPVLNDLVLAALRENWDLMIASARIEEYAGRYGVSRADLAPQIGLGYDVYKQRGTLPGTALKGDYNSYEPILSGSWEIDLWGKIRRQNETARAQLIASEEGRRGVILSLVASVAGGYVNLRNLDRQLEISVATKNTREASYKIFKDRYDGGVVSLLELNQNKSLYEEALASIPAIEKSIAQQENALSLLLGRNPGPIARGKTIDDLVLPTVPAGLPSSLLERRPDIRESEQNLIAANAQIGAAKAAYFPTISLTAFSGFASASLSNLFESSSRVWQHGAAINLPIFTGGKIGAQVDVAEAQQKQALFDYQKTIQNAFGEVNDALADQNRTREQLAAQSQQVQTLKDYAELASLRYDNGYSTYIEVLDAEKSLFSAELQRTRTQQALLQSMVNLYKAMGGGWAAADVANVVSTPPGH